MGKLKQLKEKRASIFSQIDELRRAADGRAMTAEEQQRWNTLMTEYNNDDSAVKAEERFLQIQHYSLSPEFHVDLKFSSDLFTYKNRMTFVIRPFKLRRERYSKL